MRDAQSKRDKAAPPFERIFEVDYDALARRSAPLPRELGNVLRLFDGTRTLRAVVDASDDGDPLKRYKALDKEGLLVAAAVAGEGDEDDDGAVDAWLGEAGASPRSWLRWAVAPIALAATVGAVALVRTPVRAPSVTASTATATAATAPADKPTVAATAKPAAEPTTTTTTTTAAAADATAAQAATPSGSSAPPATAPVAAAPAATAPAATAPAATAPTATTATPSPPTAPVAKTAAVEPAAAVVKPSAPPAVAATVAAKPTEVAAVKPTAVAARPTEVAAVKPPAPVAVAPVIPTAPVLAVDHATPASRREREPVVAAAAVDPQRYQALVAEGRARYAKGQWKQARAAYATALQLEPARTELLVPLARCQLDGGQLGDAVDSARRAIAARGDEAEAYLIIGTVEQQRSHTREARAAYQKYLALAPNAAYAADVRAVLRTLR